MKAEVITGILGIFIGIIITIFGVALFGIFTGSIVAMLGFTLGVGLALRMEKTEGG